MRINRLYGPDEPFVSGEVFARAFTQGSAGRRADRAQISRWERGAEPVNFATLARYEQLLGVEPGRLTSTAEIVYREIHNGGRRYLPRQRDSQSAAGLLDKAIGSDRMTGLDWDRLTARLVAMRSHRRSPSEPERAIAQRLVSELAIADDLEWLLRSCSVDRLLRVERLEAAVVGACADIVADGSSQVVIEPMTILETAANRDAARRILRSITEPTNMRAYQAAWWAAAEKVNRRHFTEDQLMTLFDHATGLLAEADDLPGCRMAAASVVRSDPRQMRREALDLILRRDALARNVFASLRTTPRERSDTLIARVAGATIREMPRDVLTTDPMLALLLDEMLFHPHISRRIAATHCLEATPYRAKVAACLVRELRQRSLRDDIAAATHVIQAVGSLGLPEHRPAIELLALDPATPHSLYSSAVGALAHMRGETDDAVWSRLVLRPTQTLVYAAGVHRKTAVLRRLRDDPDNAPDIRVGASWWSRVPTSILISTRRLGWCPSSWR